MPAHALPSGRIRRRRFVPAVLVGLVITVFLGSGIARGDLPANVAVSGQPFTATIGFAEAKSITLFPRRLATEQGSKPSIAVKMTSVTLTDVCIATVAHIPIAGDVTMFVRVPGRNTTASDLVLDASEVGASIGVDTIQLGADVSSTGDIKAAATAGIAAGQATMAQARLTGLSITASSLSMKDARFDIVRGAKTC